MKNSKNILDKNDNRTKILLVLMFSLCFLMPLTSALEFDNVKSYDNTKKEVTITNSFGLGGEILKAQLLTPQNNIVPVGEEVLVARIKVNLNTLYTEGLIKEMELYNIKDKMNPITRPINYKVLSYEDEEVKKYKRVCEELQAKNGTYQSCENIEDGSKTINKEVWSDLDLNNVNKGTYEIGLFTEVKEGDYVEWIPKVAGVRVEEWASWSSEYTFDDFDYPANGQNTTIWSYDGTNTIYYNKNLGGNFTISIGASSTIDDKTVFPTSMIYSTSTNITMRINRLTFTGGNSVGTTKIYIINSTGTELEVGSWSNGVIFIPEDNTIFDILIDEENNNITSYVNGGVHQSKTLDSIKGEKGLKFYITTDNANAALEINYIKYRVSNTPSIIISSPVDHYNSTSSTVTFNITTSTPSTPLTNISLWDNSSGTFKLNQTQIISGISNQTIFTNVFNDGSYIWAVEVCNEETCVFSNNRTLYVDSSSPIIAINYGNGTLDYGVLSKNQTINYTLTDANLDYAWLDYNGTNMTLPFVNGVTNTTSFILEYGIYNATIWANDTLGYLSSQSYVWDYIIFENSRTYQNSSIELSKQTYLLNITHNSTKYPTITAKLNYGGVNYDSTVSSSINKIINNSLVLPNVVSSTNYSFFWNITTSDGINTKSIEVLSSNQTINPLLVSYCGIYNNSIINHTIRHESNYTRLYSTTQESVINLWDAALDRTYNQTFTFNKTLGLVGGEQNSTYSYCINEQGNLLFDALFLTYRTDFDNREYWIVDESINTTKSYTTHLLESSKSTLNILKVQDEYQSGIADALVTIQKYDVASDEYKILQTVKTDSNGQAVIQLEWYDVFYNFIVKIDGVTKLVTARAKIAEEEIVLSITPSTALSYDKFYSTSSRVDFDNTTNTFNAIFSRPEDKEMEVCLQVIKRNGILNSTLICDNCSANPSDTISCYIGANPSGSYQAMVYGKGSYYLFYSIMYSINQTISDAVGYVDGQILMLIIAITTCLLFVFSPEIAIVTFLAGLIGSIALGIGTINIGAMIGITIIGILILTRITK